MHHFEGGLEEWTARGLTVESARQSAAPGPARRGVLPGSSVGGPRFEQYFDYLASASFGQLLSMWLAMVVVFGLAYWLSGFVLPGSIHERGVPLGTDLSALASAIYFSFVTATSVGFGDLVPIGPVRLLVVAEAAAGLLLFGCVISKLVSRRQEQLIEEIHQLAFEDRIGRVRTNMHLLLADLQDVSSDAAARTLSPERMQSRLESVSMIFAGELKVIHELLYRPERTPDEAVLEALLSGLAADLRELSQLIHASSQVPTGQLATYLVTIRKLSDEICSDCVPRQHAGSLRRLMDDIHDLSGRL